MRAASPPPEHPRAAPPGRRPRPTGGASASRVRRVAGLTLAAGLLFAVPAAAHPYLEDGGELPVDSLATITLDLAHGCASESAGEGEPTTEVALEVPTWLRIVELHDRDGWEVDRQEAEEDDVDEVVTWTSDGAEEPAPTFDLDVVASDEPGEERYLGVFQGCENASHRWIGTPDEPADEPAVGLTLVEADPDAPAPEPEEPATAEDERSDDGVDDDEDRTATDDAEETTEDELAAAEGEAGGVASWLVPAILFVAAAAVGVLVTRRRVARG